MLRACAILWARAALVTAAPDPALDASTFSDGVIALAMPEAHLFRLWVEAAGLVRDGAVNAGPSDIARAATIVIIAPSVAGTRGFVDGRAREKLDVAALARPGRVADAAWRYAIAAAGSVLATPTGTAARRLRAIQTDPACLANALAGVMIAPSVPAAAHRTGPVRATTIDVAKACFAVALAREDAAGAMPAAVIWAGQDRNLAGKSGPRRVALATARVAVTLAVVTAAIGTWHVPSGAVQA